MAPNCFPRSFSEAIQGALSLTQKLVKKGCFEIGSFYNQL